MARNQTTPVAAPHPLEVLAFMEAFASLPGSAIAERWPDWSAKAELAIKRYRKETGNPRSPYRPHIARSDVMVDSIQAALHQWVYLPLIRAALDGAGFSYGRPPISGNRAPLDGNGGTTSPARSRTSNGA